MGLNKNLVVGVLIGVLVTLGTQWATGAYYAIKYDKFVAALNAAQNKEEVVSSYFQKRLSVRLSKSYASEEFSCDGLTEYMQALNNALAYGNSKMEKAFFENNMAEVNSLKQSGAYLANLYNNLRSEFNSKGCGAEELEYFN